MAVSNPTYSQIPEMQRISEMQKEYAIKEQKLLRHLNFILKQETTKNIQICLNLKKNIRAWLCACPKEDGKGNIWFDYGDTDDDGFYDYVSVQNNVYPIKYREKFYFNLDTKK